MTSQIIFIFFILVLSLSFISAVEINVPDNILETQPTGIAGVEIEIPKANLLNLSSTSVNVSNFANCWNTAEGVKCDVADISFNELNPSSFDVSGFTITTSFLSGIVGTYDMRGDPWYLTGTDIWFTENITVDGNASVYGWVNGKFNWTTADNWNIFDGSILTFNESKLSTQFFNASTIEVVTGTGAGTVPNIQSYNNVPYNVTEDASDVEMIVNFTDITDFNQLIIRYRSAEEDLAHTMVVQIYEPDELEWEEYGTLPGSSVYHIVEFGVYDAEEHIDAYGTVQVRFFQDEGLPPKTHMHNFDWVSIAKGFGTPAAQEVDPLSIHSDGDVPWEGNEQGNGYNSSGWDWGFFTNLNSTFANFTNVTAEYINATHQGDGSQLTGLNFVPYTGANSNVDLNQQNLTNVDYLLVNQTATGTGIEIRDGSDPNAYWGKMDIGTSGYFDIDSDRGFFFKQDGTTIAWFSSGTYGQLMYAKPVTFGQVFQNGTQWIKPNNNQFQLRERDDDGTWSVELEMNDSGNFNFMNNTIRNATFIGDGSQLTGIVSGVNGTNINVLTINSTNQIINGNLTVTNFTDNILFVDTTNIRMGFNAVPNATWGINFLSNTAQVINTVGEGFRFISGAGYGDDDNFIITNGMDGGEFYLQGGVGGIPDSAGFGGAKGGPGGAFSLLGGKGGVSLQSATGVNFGGDGGDFLIQGGLGEDEGTSSLASNTGGTGGDTFLKGGDGGRGDNAGAGLGIGGNGGNLELIGGLGGSSDFRGGDGGDVILDGGLAGFGSGFIGNNGIISLKISQIERMQINDAGAWLSKDNFVMGFGQGQDANISWDGTSMIFDYGVANSTTAWFSSNISATNFITRTSVYDKSLGSALDLIKDSDELKTNGEIDHSKFAGFTQYPVKDPDNCWEELDYTEYCMTYQDNEICQEVPYDISQLDISKYKLTFREIEYFREECGTKMEEGVSLNVEIDVLRQAMFEIKTENQMLKDELCAKDNTYSWCVGVGL